MVSGIFSLTIVKFKRQSNEKTTNEARAESSSLELCLERRSCNEIETKNKVRGYILYLLVRLFGLAGGWSPEVPDSGRLFRVVRIGRGGVIAVGHPTNNRCLQVYKRTLMTFDDMIKQLLITVLLATLFGGSYAQNDFVKGADVGFLTGQERRGVVFHDRGGRERECLELLKNDYQMSAIRMRVWVNPRGGDCDKNELLTMAKRVKALGMDLMVDFHYADSWADPAKQPIPRAWQGHTFEQMKEDLRLHTIDVLSLLKQNGIAPRWVQVGNETANGLLWPMGHIEQHPEQYAGFIRTGYDAVKEVFPEAIVIVHLDRGHKQSLYDWNLDIVKKYGGKFDMIGMSLYPYWAMDGHPEQNADDIITDCMANIRHCSEKYGCDVMIVETGYEVDERHPEKMEEGRRQLTRVIREARSETNGRCRGVFYWEPQCLPGGYKLGAFSSNAAPTVIMDGFIEH